MPERLGVGGIEGIHRPQASHVNCAKSDPEVVRLNGSPKTGQQPSRHLTAGEVFIIKLADHPVFERVTRTIQPGVAPERAAGEH
jgi:hypothetical protein